MAEVNRYSAASGVLSFRSPYQAVQYSLILKRGASFVSNVKRILNAIKRGDAGSEQLLPLVHDELPKSVLAQPESHITS